MKWLDWLAVFGWFISALFAIGVETPTIAPHWLFQITWAAACVELAIEALRKNEKSK